MRVTRRPLTVTWVRGVFGENPFCADMSGYGYVQDKELVSVYPTGSLAHTFHLEAHNYFRAFVLDPKFACIAGQAAVRADHYAFCCYADMEAEVVAEGVCHDLMRYRGQFAFGRPFNTFVACFEKPQIDSQITGVEPFYRLLLNVYLADRKYYAGVEDVSFDVDSPEFGFFVSGESFFVPFLYAFSGSLSRRTEFNFVVFNSHKVFSYLRGVGIFEKLKERIRDKMPSVHPNLGDHGLTSEFIQYALVNPDVDSQIAERVVRDKVLGNCPFHPNSDI